MIGFWVVLLIGLAVLRAILSRFGKGIGTVKQKGVRGEQELAAILRRVRGYHKTLTNVYIPKEYGGSTEIDVIFLHASGIYVFESKNFRGVVTGDTTEAKWRQGFLDSDRYFMFYNPIWQNAGHIRALKKVLNKWDDGYYLSFVVFGNNCRIRGIRMDEDDPGVYLLHRKRVLSAVKQIIKEDEPIFTNRDIDAMYKTLEKYTNVPTKIKQKHVKYVESVRQS